MIQPTGLQVITSLDGIKDIRLTLGDLIDQRLSLANLATMEVSAAIDQLGDMLASDTADRIRDDALFFK